MAEQHRLALRMRAEPPRDGLRGRIFAIDAVDDPVQFECRKRPVDRGPRRFDGITLAAELLCDTPTDLEPRPDRRIERADASDECAAGLFLDHEHAEAMQHPMPGHERGVAPADHRLRYGLAVRRDEARAEGIAEHRGVRRDIRAAPLPKDETLGLDPRPVRLRQRGALFQRRHHFLSSFRERRAGLPSLYGMAKRSQLG